MSGRGGYRLMLRVGAAILLGAIAPASVVGRSHAGPQALTTPPDYAWATVRQPATSGTWTLPASQGETSAGTSVSVTHVETGQWVVRLPGLGANNEQGGAPLVGPLSPSLASCWVNGWGPDPDTMTTMAVEVGCLAISPTGPAPADVPFVLSYIAEHRKNRAPGAPGRYLDYVYEPNTNGNASVAGPRSWSSRPETDFKIVRDQVTDNGVTEVEPVTANVAVDYQAVLAAPVGGPGFCRSSAWSFGSFIILCSDVAGQDRWMPFVARAAIKVGLNGFAATPGALVTWTVNEQTGKIKLGKTWASTTMAPIVKRIGVGVYSVVLKGLPSGGAAIADGYSWRGQQCQVASIRLRTRQATLEVRCFRLDGSPADAFVRLLWSH